jgi:iron complex transport system substrate-binding protein
MDKKEKGALVMRIVSLCPSNTEILACLGLTESLVGVDHYSDWPPEVQSLPDLGPDLHINIEKVKALHPDLIVASLSVPGMEKIVSEIEAMTIPYLVLAPHRLNDIYDTILEVGEACDCYQKAVALVQAMKGRLEEITEKCPSDVPVKRLYWEWWPKPVFSPGGNNWLTDLSEVVRAENIFAHIARDQVKTDWQTVAEKKPDYTLVVWTGVPAKHVPVKKILSRTEWQGAPFAQPDRVHVLEEGWYCRPSPRLVTGAEHLAHLLYPERFPEARNF